MSNQITVPLEMLVGPTPGGGSGYQAIDGTQLRAALVQMFGQAKADEIFPTIEKMILASINVIEEANGEIALRGIVKC